MEKTFKEIDSFDTHSTANFISDFQKIQNFLKKQVQKTQIPYLS